MKNSAIVIFEKSLSEDEKKRLASIPQSDVIVAYSELRDDINALGHEWSPLEDLVEAGSIYEASAFLEELSLLTLPDGTRIAKSFLYEGYELWWIHYTELFLNFSVPYIQYRKMLAYLENFEMVTFYNAPFKSLFSCYLTAHERRVSHVGRPGIRPPAWLPFGMLLQIILTLIFLPIIALQRRSVLIFTGDKFEGANDFDFRFRYIYGELRKRKVPFVEFIRSLESWKNVLAHAMRRKRPVLYSAAMTFIARFVSTITGTRRRCFKEFSLDRFESVADTQERFKRMVASQYLLTVADDVWDIRIMKLILRIIGIKAAYITAANDRNFATVLGCKLNEIPTVGILHGVASRFYNVYDFFPTYDGEKSLSVDTYGLWSEWWKEYYVRHSKAYTEDQLHVSGLMRPFAREDVAQSAQEKHAGPIKALFVSEQLAVPEEVLPYLKTLMHTDGVEVFLVFRPYRDGFEGWLKAHHPEILEELGEAHIFRNGIKEGVPVCDIVVGSHSTAVLESLPVLKPMVFFATNKWGDYFDLKGYHPQFTFYAEDPDAFVACVRSGMDVPEEVLRNLQKRFFGDPCQNGSAWVVDELIARRDRRHEA